MKLILALFASLAVTSFVTPPHAQECPTNPCHQSPTVPGSGHAGGQVASGAAEPFQPNPSQGQEVARRSGDAAAGEAPAAAAALSETQKTALALAAQFADREGKQEIEARLGEARTSRGANEVYAEIASTYGSHGMKDPAVASLVNALTAVMFEHAGAPRSQLEGAMKTALAGAKSEDAAKALDIMADWTARQVEEMGETRELGGMEMQNMMSEVMQGFALTSNLLGRMADVQRGIIANID